MNWNEQASLLIEQLGYTQQALMPAFGVSSRSAVGHYLSGRRQPKPNQLKNLADFLGVKVDDFFTTSNLAAAAPKNNLLANSLVERLRQTSDASAKSETLGRRYDWSNPDGLSDATLILKVLRAGRFPDLLVLASRLGIESLEEVSGKHQELAKNPWLQRKLNNIRSGFNLRAA